MVFPLNSLNPPQRDAVTYCGPKHCLILAGAGSGKTRVLTHRIAWLISQGVAPASILAITFTNKAAREMKERALALIQCGDNAPPQLSTFHAFGARFLRQYAAYAGLESSFSIYDEANQKSLVKKIMTQLALIGAPASELTESDNKKSNQIVAETMYTIMSWKEAGTNIDAARSEARTREMQNIVNVYEQYEKQLLANNAVDFAGLLLKPLEILSNFANVRDRIQARYRHILVDEFQDTNSVQLNLLGLLCGPGTQLTVVGDDDQSIYTWHGADPTAILEFSQRFGPSEVFKLEQNYRSTKPILSCAGNLIAFNEKRTEKRLWTEQEGGEPVHVRAYESDWDEASDIIQQIIQRHRTQDIPWQNIAILYRKNNQSVSFERECTHHAIPYQIIGATGFYEREEILDLMAYLRILVNPADMIAFRRIINKPARGIGEKTCDKLIELIEKKAEFGLSPTECLVSTLQDIASEKCKIPRAGKALTAGAQALLALFERVENWQNCPPRETLIAVIDETHFMDHLRKITAKKNQEYTEAEDRIQSLLQELDAHQKQSPNDLRGFLEDMTLIRPEADDALHAVNLMTIHSSKGLEFDAVYIVGVADGILPLERGGCRDVEEERRLMYVAMTRARHVLTLSYAQMQHEYGRMTTQAPSQFIDEMQRPSDEQYVEITHIAPPDQGYSPSFTPKLAWSSSKPAPKTKPASGFFEEVGEAVARPFKSKKLRSQDEFEADPCYEEEAIDIHADCREEEEFCAAVQSESNIAATSKNGRPITIGTHVQHSVHGRGVVVKVEKSGNDFKASVLFRKSGVRTIIARFLEVF
ncbi:MAG: UvrD-helicase domain-containing protein [Proteobacteria bacterium]|nr:UvrD-helicase domain-containing protein [Pseudomonadota bacterium]